jgi:photosystem II stability/assembly factor-like uncharacterized protein
MTRIEFIWWLRNTAVRMVLFSMALVLVISAGITHARTQEGNKYDELVQVYDEENNALQLMPLLSPASASCDQFWATTSTSISMPAFLTLNVAQANSSNSAEWRPDLPFADTYRVEAYIAAPPANPNCTFIDAGTQNTTQANYRITHATGTTTVTINQSAVQNNWVSLGSYTFNAGSGAYVTLSDVNNETPLSRIISFGAIRFVSNEAMYTFYLSSVHRNIYVPPTPAPSGSIVVIRQKQAFDSCYRPTVSQAQTWWNTSPYDIYNIYMGGVSNAGCFPENLTASYITSLRNQGWEFIPTWVGPQAPCTSFKFRHSLDPSNAFGEGIQEANAAYNRAVQLGLVGSINPKTVIYYDMEAFDTLRTNDACRLAVRSFLSGWSQRLHELGARSGVYGSSCYHMPEWSNLSNPLDDVWLASWYRIDGEYRYDPNANVWNVLCLSRSVWTDHQRIRQYSGGHNETWGGVTLNIDGNVTDGRVVSPPKTISGDTAIEMVVAPATLVEQTIDEFQLVTSQQGWALRDDQLLWTPDGGENWISRSPADLGGNTLGAFFLDTEHGWLASANSEDGSWQILNTQDGGQSWSAVTLPVDPLTIGFAEKVHFDFLDSQTGWAAVKLGSSSAFSLGVLFATTDGGQTWQTRTLPIGEPVKFVDALNGWTAGGASGGELYTTRDGGLTWQDAAFLDNSARTVFYGLPEFSDAKNGQVAVTIVEPGQPRLEYYRTQDGGQTWEISGLIAIDPENEPGMMLPTALLGDQNIIAVDESLNRLFASGDQGILPSQPQAASLPEGVVEINFISALEGWVKTVRAMCSGEKSPEATQPINCQVREGLWQTLDGGLTWTPIR